MWDYLLCLLSFIAHIVCVVDFAGKKPLQKWLWLDGEGWEGGMREGLGQEKSKKGVYTVMFWNCILKYVLLKM